MRVGDERYAPAALTTAKTRYPLYRRPGGPQDRSGWVLKSRPNRDSIPDRPRFTDRVIPAHYGAPYEINICINDSVM